MPRVVFLIITWIVWFLFAQGALFAGIFLTSPSDRTNTFSSLNPLLSIGVFLLLAVFGGGVRFAISKINNEWLVLVLSIVGIIISQLPIYFGAFLAPEFKVVFQALSAVLFALYIPQFLFPKSPELAAA